MARGAPIAPLECTFDASADPPVAPPEPEAPVAGPSRLPTEAPPDESAPEDPRITALEDRIRALEAELLVQRQGAASVTVSAGGSITAHADGSLSPNGSSQNGVVVENSIFTTAEQRLQAHMEDAVSKNPVSARFWDVVMQHSVNKPTLFSPELLLPSDMALDTPLCAQPPSGLSLPLPQTLELPPNWPEEIPGPELMAHLAETVFICHPYVGRMLHQRTFFDSLSMPPKSPAFPCQSLLHAICALGSCYTSVVEQAKLPDVQDLPPEGWLFRNRFMKNPDPNAPFGEQHARMALTSAWGTDGGSGKLVQNVQAVIILQWYTYIMGSPTNCWIMTSKAARMSIPLGLNVGEGYEPLSRFRPSIPTILPPPRNTIELEERRNAFWMMWISERLLTPQVTWGILFDDDDVSQLLPLTDEDFNHGNSQPLELRQHLANPDLLTTHIPELSSSLTFLIKAVYLVSRVQAFNHRSSPIIDPSVDVRATEDFKRLDFMINGFQLTWPFIDFRSEGKVDPVLMMAEAAVHLAIILLHRPYADYLRAKSSYSRCKTPFDPCASANRVIDSAKALLEGICELSDTSFDFLLLDHSIGFCWFTAGSVLVDILKLKIQTNHAIGVIKINSAIDIIKHALARLGEKTIIGRRLLKMLNEAYANEITNAPGSDAVVSTYLAPCCLM